jgi:hypothetical protein
MTFDEYKNLTPEQRKEIEKSVSEARRSLLWVGLKFSVGLFFANLIAIVVMIFFLKGSDIETLQDFQTVAIIVNFVFMFKYFYGQMKKVNDILTSKIKEVLKK